MLLQAAGGSLKDAQAQLGHSKASTTLDIYTNHLPDSQRQAVENLGILAANGSELASQAAAGSSLALKIQ